MMEQIEFILDYIGKSFILLDKVPLIAGVSLGAFLVFMVICETIIHLTYNHEEIRSTQVKSEPVPKYQSDYYKFRGG